MTNQSKERLSALEVDLIEDEQTITQELHLYWFEPLGKYMVFTAKGVDSSSFVFVKTIEVEIPVPANFDFREAKLAGLREEEKRVRAEFQARITELQRQQSELLAIEMAEAA